MAMLAEVVELVIGVDTHTAADGVDVGHVRPPCAGSCRCRILASRGSAAMRQALPRDRSVVSDSVPDRHNPQTCTTRKDFCEDLG